MERLHQKIRNNRQGGCGVIANLFKHIETGNLYAVIGFCLVKINGEWTQGVMYKDEGICTYVRTTLDFEAKFVALLPTEGVKVDD